MQRIAVTGASGLIGTALVGKLKSDGYTVQRLVRRPTVSSEEIFWNPTNQEIDLDALAGVDAVIHLAGAGVGDKRWTKKYKSEILNSRLLGTTTIANAVAQIKPEVFISSSAIGWYGETGNRAVIESDRGGDDFLAAVCREWEAAADLAGKDLHDLTQGDLNAYAASKTLSDIRLAYKKGLPIDDIHASNLGLNKKGHIVAIDC